LEGGWRVVGKAKGTIRREMGKGWGVCDTGEEWERKSGREGSKCSERKKWEGGV
jgi:hypothetical protein